MRKYNYLRSSGDRFSDYFNPTSIEDYHGTPPDEFGNPATEWFFNGRAESMGQGIAGKEISEIVGITLKGWGGYMRDYTITESEKASDLGAWIVATKSVPEPGMIFLFGSGLIGLAVVRMKCKKR